MTDDHDHLNDDAFDAFDSELTAMFAEVAPPAEDPVFVEHVTKRLANPDRVRFLALGGAGATGSAVAGSQLENLVGLIPADQVNGVLGQALGFFGPEAIVTALFGLMALGFAWVLPGVRSYI